MAEFTYNHEHDWTYHRGKKCDCGYYECKICKKNLSEKLANSIVIDPLKRARLGIARLHSIKVSETGKKLVKKHEEALKRLNDA